MASGMLGFGVYGLKLGVPVADRAVKGTKKLGSGGFRV